MTTPAIITIADACLAVLNTAEAREKADIAQQVTANWQAGQYDYVFNTSPPMRPARPKKPILLNPGQTPKRRKAGSNGNRAALLHAVAHIELNAIDLAFDIVARFGGGMPRAFTDDWIQVGGDEGRHFNLIEDRLHELGFHYGDMAAHDGLWQSAEATAHMLAARLAVVPMVLEARGLDVTPSMIERFERVQDNASAEVLKTIYNDEISHVAAGQRWFTYLSKIEGENPESWFQSLVNEYFAGKLKRPFNVQAREKAGLFSAFYEPLAG